MKTLEVNFAGLRLKNPLIAAAGPITANVEAVERLADAGIAAIVTKTGFTQKEYEKWVERKNIFPYKPVYKYQSFGNGRLLSLPTLADEPVEVSAKKISHMKKTGIPIIGSIMGLSVEGYIKSAKILAEAGVDAIELDLCCTIPEFTTKYKYAGQNVNFSPKIYAQLIEQVQKAVTVPVGVKSTVSLYMYVKIFEGLIRAKIKNHFPDFITLTGQLDYNPGVDLETLQTLVPHICTMGWQGDLSGLTFSAVAAFASALGTTSPQISASGGIVDYRGVINCLALGATTVQPHTVILDKGPKVITKILADLKDYLQGQSIPQIGQIIGIASKEYLPSLMLGKFMRERDQLYGKVYAEIEADKCSACGICTAICTENGISMDNGKPRIDAALCRGCNLCVLKCPKQAIKLNNFEAVEDLISGLKASISAQSFKDFMAKPKITWRDLLALPALLKLWGFK